MIGALVLAAGRSRRMGTQKLLLPLQGRPVIAHVVDELLRSRMDRVLVVVGEDEGPIREAIADRPVQFVTNSRAEGEMLSSVRCGLAVLPAQCAAVLVALGDQPGIAAPVVAKLVDAFGADGGGIVVPTYQGKRGHPLLIAMRYRNEILTRYDNVGLRGLLDAHPEDVLGVEVASPDVLEDIDVPADYLRTVDRWTQPSRSGPRR